MRGGSCAIVGNSGLLKFTRFGADVDAHDVVVRMNAAPTLGEEGRVGTRTTARVLNNALVKHITTRLEDGTWNHTTCNQVRRSSCLRQGPCRSKQPKESVEPPDTIVIV